MSRRGFDWRKAFEKQHGYRPGASSAIAASAVDPRAAARKFPSESNQGKTVPAPDGGGPGGVASRHTGGRTPDRPAPTQEPEPAALSAPEVAPLPAPTPDGVDETGLCIRTERGWRCLGGPMRPVPPVPKWWHFGGLK